MVPRGPHFLGPSSLPFQTRPESPSSQAACRVPSCLHLGPGLVAFSLHSAGAGPGSMEP